jgi:hypothetical protein
LLRPYGYVNYFAYFACLLPLAEEAKDSSRNVPVTLLSGYGVNVILGLFVLITWQETVIFLQVGAIYVAFTPFHPWICRRLLLHPLFILS